MSAKLNVDCYYFYYSKCSKGASCPYRHADAALGSETTCPDWLKGACTNGECPLRHMKITASRAQTPCYWEKTATGCLKNNCPFLHTLPKNTNSGSNGHPGSSPLCGTEPVVVSLADSEESDEERDNTTPPQQGRPVTSETVVSSATNGRLIVGNASALFSIPQNSNRRIVLPSTKSSEPQHIAVISGKKPIKSLATLASGDLRLVLAGANTTPKRDIARPAAPVAKPVETTVTIKPEVEQRRQNRLKRFCAGGIADSSKTDQKVDLDKIETPDAAKTETLGEEPSPKIPKTHNQLENSASDKSNEASVSAATTNSSPPNENIDEDQLLGLASSTDNLDTSNLKDDDLITFIL